MKVIVGPSELAAARRVRRGWSQRKLAAIADVPAGSIAAAEAGWHELTDAQKGRIGDALGLSPEERRLIRELAP